MVIKQEGCAAQFVKDEIPDVETLDTFWKVGAWTWTWMEPAIGTASFVLLALQVNPSASLRCPTRCYVRPPVVAGVQLVRSHMKKIDLKPYHAQLSSMRADRLCAAFPRVPPPYPYPPPHTPRAPAARLARVAAYAMMLRARRNLPMGLAVRARDRPRLRQVRPLVA